jgi:hypothetical protein
MPLSIYTFARRGLNRMMEIKKRGQVLSGLQLKGLTEWPANRQHLKKRAMRQIRMASATILRSRGVGATSKAYRLRISKAFAVTPASPIV